MFTPVRALLCSRPASVGSHTFQELYVDALRSAVEKERAELEQLGGMIFSERKMLRSCRSESPGLSPGAALYLESLRRRQPELEADWEQERQEMSGPYAGTEFSASGPYAGTEFPAGTDFSASGPCTWTDFSASKKMVATAFVQVSGAENTAAGYQGEFCAASARAPTSQKIDSRLEGHSLCASGHARTADGYDQLDKERARRAQEKRAAFLERQEMISHEDAGLLVRNKTIESSRPKEKRTSTGSAQIEPWVRPHTVTSGRSGLSHPGCSPLPRVLRSPNVGGDVI
jgi:hypothetical protein